LHNTPREEQIVMDDGAAATRLAMDCQDANFPLNPREDVSMEDAALSLPDEADTRQAPTPRLVAPTPDVEPQQIVEALLFASDAPLSLARLTELANCGTQTEVRCWIADLNLKYTTAGLAFRIEEIARGYQMLTLPAFRPWLMRLDKQRSQTRLSDAALETLAIIAYKQPIIRADIEAIRGVACGEVLHRLREAGLIKIAGRAEVVGRPMLYGTTRKFLDQFGLADLDDLPPMEALTLRRGPALVKDTPEAADAEAGRPPAVPALHEAPPPEARAAAGA
jgi:segregation and condensation protein B